MGAKIPQMEWGWRLQCAHPTCLKYLSRFCPPPNEPIWFGNGPPPLPATGRYNKVTLEPENWFFHKTYQSGGHIYRAYCPQHSGPALAWVEQMDRWRDARYAFGKVTHSNLLRRWLEWGALVLNWKVGQTVEDWIVHNPRPCPPWKIGDL